MKKIMITEKQRQEARLMASEMGVLNNSITKGKGNVIGFLGEIIVRDKYNGESTNTYDYDLTMGGFHVDVKTKQCTSQPKSYYECSIAGYNTSQKCDAYIFVRILKDLSVGWILGFKIKNQYFTESVFHKKGDKDTSNNFTFHCDSYNMKISDLNKL